MLKDDKTQPVILEEVCEDVTNEIVITEKSDKDDIDNMQHVLVPRKEKMKRTFELRKRSWVWKYFERLTNTTYRCNLCNVVLSIKQDYNTNNMNRHVRTKHPSVYKAEVDTKKAYSDIDQSETSWKKEDESDKDIDKSLDLLKQRRSWIWPYFKRITATLAQCKICERNMCHGENATGNMNRHLKLIHNKTPEFSRKRCWVWKYFKRITNITYRCNLCNVVISIKGCNTYNMTRHVRAKHPSVYKANVDTKKAYSDIDQSDTRRKKEVESDKDIDKSLDLLKQRRSWIWSYFKRITATLAQCKICERNICHGGKATGNLNRHLKMIHNKTPESSRKRSWVWKYFERLTDITYRCNLCKVVLSIKKDYNTNNMNRHVRTRHPSVYKANVDTKKAYSDIDQSDTSWKKVDESDKDIDKSLDDNTGLESV